MSKRGCVWDGHLEAAAAQILDGSDASLLSHQEIQSSYGSNSNFMLSYGLKPWDPEDVAEARCISQAIKCGYSSGGSSKREREWDDDEEEDEACGGGDGSAGSSQSLPGIACARMG